jgi:hypothetical protein
MSFIGIYIFLLDGNTDYSCCSKIFISLKAPELLKAGKLISLILSSPVNINNALLWSFLFEYTLFLIPNIYSTNKDLNSALICIFLVEENNKLA